MHRLKKAVSALLGLVALYFIYHLALSLAIQERINSIHRTGFPATCIELDKWYVQPPAGQNAADVYTEAFARFETWTNKLAESSIPADSTNKSKFYSAPETKRDLLPIVGLAKLPPRTEPLPAEMQQLVAEYLSDNAEALRLLHQAASMKSCRYPIDLTKGLATRLGPLNSLRQAERLLYLEAILNLERQQPQQAVDSVITSLGVSRSLKQEQMLIAYLVQVACQGIGLDCLQRVLNRMPLTDEQLGELAEAIEELENDQALTRAFVGERCLGLDGIQGLRTGRIPLEEIFNPWEPEPSWIRPLWPLCKATGLVELDEKRYLDIMEQLVKATQLPLPESIDASHAVNEEVEHLPRWRVLSRLLLGSLSTSVNKAGGCAAKVRDAQTAIAVERYRAANGKLPDELSDLIPTFLPAVPVDPFDGMPLRYKKLAKGYVVYSVGEDREDNGGAETNSNGCSYGPGTDITFTVER
ncbi:MAG: hypothetical protein ABSG14_12460 [Verrucomicrobiia bacterium]